MHTKWKKSELAILGLLGVLAVAAIIALVRILLEYNGGDAVYKGLEAYVFLPEEEDVALQQGADSDSGRPGQAENTGRTDEPATAGMADSGHVYYGQQPQVNFEALRTQNEDVVGWIYGPGTTINYPIVQGEDNIYYLTHMFNGKENKCGSIFMDSLNETDFSNTNSIIHGHHMRNGSMFASLTKYGSQSYYDTHPVLWLTTPEESYQVEIFAGFVTDVDSDAWQIEFATKEEYKAWLDQMVGNSVFESDVKPEAEDRILTLATCSYEYDDARFVVMGILR